jgi:hypothetical protein
MPVILAIWKAEIGGTAVQDSPGTEFERAQNPK